MKTYLNNKKETTAIESMRHNNETKQFSQSLIFNKFNRFYILIYIFYLFIQF